MDEQKNTIQKEVALLDWPPVWIDEKEEMTSASTKSEPQRCILFHISVATPSKDSCTPNHWHPSYWFAYVRLIEQETTYAVVQHTDTKRYHLMVQLPDKHLSCDECYSSREVFRMPVQDHYAYFVFVPDQDLDGFMTGELA